MISNLPDEQVKRFKSDFRSLIEFIKKRKDIKYKVTSRKLDHPYEFAQLIYALTNDERSLEMVDELIDENHFLAACFIVTVILFFSILFVKMIR